MPDNTEKSMDETIERFRHSSQHPIEWSTPSEGTWDAIASALDFAPISEAAPASTRGATQLNRRTLFAGLAGLAAGAVLGVAGLKVAQNVTGPQEIPVRQAVLTPLDREDEQLGVAELRPRDVGYSLVVDVPEGASHAGGYVEVWLINVDLERMVSVGVFAAGTEAEFFVSDALVDAGYLIVDLSNEEFDDEPRHSGDTIMRGELRA